MGVKPGTHKNISSKAKGFTLLELIVVMAGLGILSSLAIPNFLKYLDYAKVDEAKSLLNSTAADCLQGLRRNSSRLLEPVDGNIISFSRLKNTGYIFKDNNTRITGTTEEEQKYLPNCENVLITAAQLPDRDERLPDLGFSINDSGTLTKIAVNSGSETEFAAESWAGANTTDEATLIEWLKLNEDITKAKAKCQENLDNFTTGRTNMWDPEKTKSCTDKPPISETPETCTPSGCTKKVWYIDGEFCGYEEADFRECQRAKTTAACQAEKDNKASEQPPWTTETISGDQLPNCEKPVWFYEGVDVGSAAAWTPLMCDREKRKLLTTIHSDPVDYCETSPIYIIGGEEILPDASREDAKQEFDDRLAKNKESQCSNLLREDAKKKTTPGPHTSPTPEGMEPIIPDDCGVKYWYCKESGKIYKGADGETDFNADKSCEKKSCEVPDINCSKKKFESEPICVEYFKCLNG
ncbi:type II secretion system protein [Synechococcus sp. YX-04-1]|uniref:type IV pilin protein n=1 Tax=Synechococcus sp. YX-04-1 TaxID=3062778 RepID=UPI0026E2C7AD|nr:type II secretion system protein [Synechococcus sp. YX-04-1]MDO6351465.1 type II secretion system protein [Synechococcus sp. YX-04-1]